MSALDKFVNVKDYSINIIDIPIIFYLFLNKITLNKMFKSVFLRSAILYMVVYRTLYYIFSIDSIIQFTTRIIKVIEIFL